MSSEQLAEFKQFGDRVSRDASFMSTIANDSREARDMTARLASTHARSERAEASLAERTAFAERVSPPTRRETISIDIAQDPHNLEMFLHAEHYGGNSAAAFTFDGIGIGTAISSPKSSVSDGTALPALWRYPGAACTSETMPPLTPDIAGLQSNREQTHGLGTPSRRRESHRIAIRR